MALKALKEYGIKFTELKNASKALNETDLAKRDVPVKVGTKGTEMLQAFMEAIDSVPEDMLDSIPEEAAALYNSIPEKAFADAEEGNTASEKKVNAKHEKAATKKAKEKVDKKNKKKKKVVDDEEDVTDDAVGETITEIASDCPIFGKGWNARDKECKACKKDAPDEYKECRTLTKASKKKAVSKKTTKATGKKTRSGKKKTPPKPIGIRTRYGHQPGSMAGAIDDLVYEGNTLEDIAKYLSDKFDRSKDKAIRKARSHINVLKNVIGITIKTKDTDDGLFIKAKQKYAKNFDKNNTTSGLIDDI